MWGGHLTHFVVLTKKVQNFVKRDHEGTCDTLFEFCDPLIYQGRMKLETSNLAQRCKIVCTNDIMQNLVKWVMWGSRDPILVFGTP